MKVFVSSRFQGMQEARAGACQAILDLGYEPITVEDFPAMSRSPRVACLDGVRQAGSVVLLLGESYGDRQQSSGLSATHEEFREARDTRDLLAFVQEGIAPEPAQAALMKEVGDWSGGTLQRTFKSPDELRSRVTGAIAQWQLARAAGPLDADALADTAKAMLPVEDRGYVSSQGPTVAVSVAHGPPQSILRPSEIEDHGLQSEILQAALFGPNAIFDAKRGSSTEIERSALILNQEGGASLSVDPRGVIRVQLPLPHANRDFGLSAIIEEDVASTIQRGIDFCSWLINRIDPTHRLTHAAIAVNLLHAGGAAWRTRQRHAAQPQSMTMRMWGENPKPVMLSPPVRPRAVLSHDSRRLVEDLITLLRREWRTESD